METRASAGDFKKNDVVAVTERLKQITPLLRAKEDSGATKKPQNIHALLKGKGIFCDFRKFDMVW